MLFGTLEVTTEASTLRSSEATRTTTSLRTSKASTTTRLASHAHLTLLLLLVEHLQYLLGLEYLLELCVILTIHLQTFLALGYLLCLTGKQLLYLLCSLLVGQFLDLLFALLVLLVTFSFLVTFLVLRLYRLVPGSCLSLLQSLLIVSIETYELILLVALQFEILGQFIGLLLYALCPMALHFFSTHVLWLSTCANADDGCYGHHDDCLLHNPFYFVLVNNSFFRGSVIMDNGNGKRFKTDKKKC